MEVPFFRMLQEITLPMSLLEEEMLNFMQLMGQQGILSGNFGQIPQIRVIVVGTIFSSAQMVPDQNADGKADLLLANGGDHTAPPWQTERDPGHLMVIDAATGAILAAAVMPDSAETYCSPIHVDLAGTGNFQIIYGTGGEHAGGSMWKTTLEDVMTGDISTSIQLATAPNKGFIAPASAADFNADNIKDIVIQGYNGKITVVDGVTNNEKYGAISTPM